jgi:DNA-binding Xre family transcriptional regulator
MKRIRLRLRECLDERGMTMTTLSHRTEISYKTIQKLVHDPYAMWGKDTIERIMTALDVSIYVLLEEEDLADELD